MANFSFSNKSCAPVQGDFPHCDTVGEANLEFLKAQKYCDVTFLVGEEKMEIKCHKLFLISRSPVFAAMFSERWIDGERKYLVHTEPETFQLLLEFIYGDKLPTSIPMIIRLLELGDEYDIRPLVRKCEELMGHEIKLNNAIQTFVAARFYSLTELMDQAGDFMTTEFHQLAKDPSFRDIDEETLIYLLKRNDLALSECELFTIVLRWARENIGESPHGNRSYGEVTKNILPLIRFPLMTAQEFATNVVRTGVLSQKQIIDLFLYFNSDEIVSVKVVNQNNDTMSQAVNFIPMFRKEVARGIPFSFIPREKGETIQFDFYECEGNMQPGNFYPGLQGTTHPMTHDMYVHEDHHEAVTEICYTTPKEHQMGDRGKSPVAKLVSVFLKGLNYDRKWKSWRSNQAPNPSHNVLVLIETQKEPGGSSVVLFAEKCLITKGTESELKLIPSIAVLNGQKFRIRVQFQETVAAIREFSKQRMESNYDMLTCSYLTPSISKSGMGTLTVDMVCTTEEQNNDLLLGKPGWRIRGLHVLAGLKLVEL